jgi:hypothetical protein
MVLQKVHLAFFFRTNGKNGDKRLINLNENPTQRLGVERNHRQIMELGLATMFNTAIPSQYWTVESVIFVINHILSSSLSFSTLYNILFQRNSDYSFFKVISCTHIQDHMPQTN